MADTKDLGELDRWIRRVKAMQSLSPRKVIAGHSCQGERSSDPAILPFTQAYLETCRELLAGGQNAAAIVSAMTEGYPDHAGKDDLLFGARIITGQEQWAREDLCPGIGHLISMDFSPAAVFDVEFADSKTLTFPQAEGEGKGYTDAMGFTAEEAAENVFMVHWQENTGIAVVHIQNWNTLGVCTNICTPGQPGIRLKGTMTRRER